MVGEADLILVTGQQVFQRNVGLGAMRALEVGEFDELNRSILGTLCVTAGDRRADDGLARVPVVELRVRAEYLLAGEPSLSAEPAREDEDADHRADDGRRQG